MKASTRSCIITASILVVGFAMHSFGQDVLTKDAINKTESGWRGGGVNAAASMVDQATLLANEANQGDLLITGNAGLASPNDSERSKLVNESHALDAKTRAILVEYALTSDAQKRQSLLESLHSAVEAQFTVRQSIREQELADLDAQLKRLRTLHQQRSEQKDRIVNDRVQQLLRDAEGLGWGTVETSDASWSPNGGVNHAWAIPRAAIDRIDLHVNPSGVVQPPPALNQPPPALNTTKGK